MYVHVAVPTLHAVQAASARQRRQVLDTPRVDLGFVPAVVGSVGSRDAWQVYSWDDEPWHSWLSARHAYRRLQTPVPGQPLPPAPEPERVVSIRYAAQRLAQAHALMLEAEAAVRRGDLARASAALAACEEWVLRHDLRVVGAAALAVRAALCERSGDTRGYLRALRALAAWPGDAPPSPALRAALERGGVAVPSSSGVGSVIDLRIHRLGLAEVGSRPPHRSSG